MRTVPPELIAYHAAGHPLCCEIQVQPWRCEFWPLNEVLAFNVKHEVGLNAPGYLGFATSGGGEMYAFSPRGSIVYLAFVGMSAAEELVIAPSWTEFERMLHDAF